MANSHPSADLVSDTSPATFENDSRVSFIAESGKYVYIDTDGVQYEWDDEKRSWFPMWNEQNVENQQSVYNVEGAADDVVLPPSLKRKLERGGSENRKKPKEKESRPVTSVYITGLPNDVTIEELKEAFSRYGIILEDLINGGPKIKIYRDPESGEPKGDALVTYFKEESVILAVQLLDDTQFRPSESNKIRVQQAEFKEKEKSADESKPQQRVNKSLLKKKYERMERKLGWHEPTVKSTKHDKVVILKHMFNLQELEKDPAVLLDIKEEVREECEKFGEVTNVILYDKEPEGIMSIRYKEPEFAKLCIQFLHGRYFGGTRIEAFIFDGKTKYRKSGGKDDEDEDKRMEKYKKWLEEDESGNIDTSGEKTVIEEKGSETNK